MSRGLVFGALIIGCLIAALVTQPPVVAEDVRRAARVALAAGDEQRLAQILDHLAEKPAGSQVIVLLEIAARAPTGALYERALEVLRGYGEASVDEALRALLEERRTDPLALAAAMVLAGAWAVPASEDWLLAGLAFDSDVVRRNAIEQLVVRRSKRAIPAFIELLANAGMHGGTLSWDARRGLIALTGRDFEIIDDWRKFWETHQDSIDPNSAPEEETGQTSVPPVEVNAPQFFGVEIVSHRVVFLIDVSGSMTLVDDAREEGGSGIDWRLRQRLRRTQAQLAQAIEKLAGRAHFNVIAFNHTIQPWQKTLVPASGTAKARAQQFVQKLRADNATHTDEALATAFADPNVDTIILLSDGAPEKSREENATVLIPRIHAQVREWNRVRRLKIFTLGFESQGRWPPGSKYDDRPPPDPGPLVEFLKRLAEDHGGRYTPIH